MLLPFNKRCYMADKSLRLVVDSSSAKQGAREITQAMGKIVSSGKHATKAFQTLQGVMDKQKGAFDKLGKMGNPFKGLETSIQNLSTAIKNMKAVAPTAPLEIVKASTPKVVNESANAVQKLTEKEVKALAIAKQSASLKERQMKADVALQGIMSGELALTIKKEQAIRNYSKAVKQELAVKSEQEVSEENLIKLRTRASNSMVENKNKLELLNNAEASHSILLNQQRKTVEALEVSKAKLAVANSNEYAQLVKNQQALAARNKELRGTPEKPTATMKAYENILQRTTKAEAMLAQVKDGSIEKMYKAEKAYKDQVAVIKQALNAKSQEQKADEALIKARLKLENTLIAERARTQALSEATGLQSVKIQEQRRLTEELIRAKARLATANTQEYADLVKTRQALELRNKELRHGSDKAKRSVDGLTASFTSLGIVLGTVSAYFSVGALARVADSYTNITNKLKAVSDATVNTNSATRELLDLSIESRSSLEGTMEIYSKMIRVNENLGKAQGEVVQLTEAVSKAVAMSGASVQGAQGSLMQFGQAMSNNFSAAGQELNSILEQTPMLAVSMAKGLRQFTGDATITTGSLKKMAEAGRLNTELVFEAMLAVLPEIRKQFKSTDQTLASAADGLSSSFTVMVGEIDKSYGVSEALVQSMKSLGEVFTNNTESVLKFTAAITGLVSAAAILGLGAILAAIGGVALATVAAVGLLAGGLAHVYLETTKSQRALDATNESLRDLKDTTEDYNEAVAIMSSAKVESGLESTNKEILEQTILLEEAITEQARLQGILKGDSNWDKFVGNLSEDLEGNFLAVNKQVKALQELLGGLGARLRALNDRRAGALMEGASNSVADFEKFVKSLNSELTERDKIDQNYQETLSKLDSGYEANKKKIMQNGDSIERLNLLRKNEMLLTEGQKNALAAYNEQLEKFKKESSKIEPTKYMVAYETIQDEIVALKQGSEAYDDLLLKRQAASELGDEADDLRIQALVAKYKELAVVKQQVEDASKPDTYRMTVESLQQEIIAVKQGEEAYNNFLLKRRAMAELGQDASVDQLEAVIAKYKELEGLTGDVKDPFTGWTDSLKEAGNAMLGFTDAIDESGKASKKLQVLLSALNVVTAVQAVLKQASDGDPYTALPRMATMLGAVASLGVSLGSLGGNLTPDYQANQEKQGTGTVLGDAMAKSESISNAVEMSAKASEKLVGINTRMLRALQTMAGAISGASNLIARDANPANINFNNIPNVSKDPLRDLADMNILGGLGGKAYDTLNKITLGGLSTVGKIFGGKSSISDEGVQIIGGAISDLVNNTTVQAFQDVKYKKYRWSSTKYRTELQGVSQSVEDQFQLIFGAMVNTVGEAASSLGMNSAEINNAINSFRIGTTRISTKGMSGEQQQEALNNVFSSIFDRFTAHVFSWATEFQKAGEGLSETLTRVVTNMQVVNETISQLGLSSLSGDFLTQIRSSEYFVNAAGGFEELASNLTSFISSFETEERKLEILQNSLTSALSEQGLVLPETKEAYLALAKAQNINTQSGANNLATLLRLQEAASEYYSSLEDVNSEMNSVFNNILDWVEALRGTSISGYETMAVAQAKYQQQLMLASSGDTEALGSITSYADRVLQAADREVGDYSQYAAIAAMLASQLTSLTDVPAFATGGYHSGGLRLVGENGPELEYTGSSQIINNTETRKMLSSAANSESSDEKLVEELVNKMIPYLYQITKNTGKSAKYIERWDGDGLPEERDISIGALT